MSLNFYQPSQNYYKDLYTVKSEILISELNIHVANNPLRYFIYKGLTPCIKVYFGNKSFRKHCNKVPEECPLAIYVKTIELSAQQQSFKGMSIGNLC